MENSPTFVKRPRFPVSIWDARLLPKVVDLRVETLVFSLPIWKKHMHKVKLDHETPRKRDEDQKIFENNHLVIVSWLFVFSYIQEKV